jgi:hypothetical protein
MVSHNYFGLRRETRLFVRNLKIRIMRSVFSLIILFVCLFMFIPLIVLIFEHAFMGEGSTLQKLLDDIGYY